MKFRITKVGKDFELEVHISASKAKKDAFSVKKAVTGFIVAVVFGSVAAAFTYGMATGDYSVLKAIAITGKEAIAAGVKRAASFSK